MTANSHFVCPPMTSEALIFVCDEAACHEDPIFYEIFTMDNRWDIIRAILKAAEAQRTPMQADIAQIIDAGWKSGKSSADVAAEILREFDVIVGQPESGS